jgi:hypothetical protein
MNNELPNDDLKLRRIAKAILASKRYARYYEFLHGTEAPRVEIELPRTVINEATKTSVGRFTARRDPPHFAGDEYHGHCSVGGGYEVSWNISGPRRHSSKFPAAVPHDARAAVAKVLNVPADILESYWIKDNGETVLLFELALAPPN